MSDVERMKRLVDVVLRASLKHGPDGRGGPGPCDKHCVKCAVEEYRKP